MGDESAGQAHLRRAIELDPGNEFASWNLATALLKSGELREGWARYESRWSRPDGPERRFASKGGWPARGKALLWAEQGVGDHILFSRMALEAAAAGAEVTLETDARLVALFRRSYPPLAVVAQTDPPQVDPAQFDHVLPLGSLGRFLRPSFEAFACQQGYLVADPARVARYRAILEHRVAPRSLIVGIAWRSSNPELGNEKSAPLAQWGALLTLPGVAFVSLQYGDIIEECNDAQRRFRASITRLPEPDPYSDLDGLAALQAACDLVITTSSVSAHLTGALGRPGWVLLPKRIGGLWYWFQDRTDCPWYPSLTLLRQSRDADWSGVMELAAQRLRAKRAGGS